MTKQPITLQSLELFIAGQLYTDGTFISQDDIDALGQKQGGFTYITESTPLIDIEHTIGFRGLQSLITEVSTW